MQFLIAAVERDRHRPASDPCTEWPFAKDKRTHYGQINFEGRCQAANRIALSLITPVPPEGRWDAAHSCHNRGCVGVHHLRWDTREGNAADMIADGTRRRGSDTNSKLSESDVREIRRLLVTTTQKEIAEMYGVTQPTITAIKHRRSWAWLE